MEFMEAKKDMERNSNSNQDRDDDLNENDVCGDGDGPRPLAARIDGLINDAQQIKFRTAAGLRQLRCSD